MEKRGLTNTAQFNQKKERAEFKTIRDKIVTFTTDSKEIQRIDLLLLSSRQGTATATTLA